MCGTTPHITTIQAAKTPFSCEKPIINSTYNPESDSRYLFFPSDREPRKPMHENTMKLAHGCDAISVLFSGDETW